MTNKFVGVLEAIGKDFQKGLAFAVKYLPEKATVLSGILFPASVAPLTAVTSTADLLQSTISVVEQKYAASGAQNGTGTQKAAEVLLLTRSAVTTMLAEPTVQKGLSAAGITVDDDYISQLVDATVAILNVRGIVPATAI